MRERIIRSRPMRGRPTPAADQLARRTDGGARAPRDGRARTAAPHGAGTVLRLHELLAAIADVAIPALFAGVVAVLATVVVERFGGAIGGVLSSIPTTVVPFAVGSYARAASEADFERAMAFVPIGILLNALYLVSWRIVPAAIGRRTRSRLLLKTVLVALGAWLVCATTIVYTNHLAQPTVGQTLVAGLIAFATGLVLGIGSNWTPHPAPKGTRRVGPVVLAVRGVAAMFVIGGALHLARLGLPVASGIASVFPVIFTTIMVATWIAQGPQVPTGAVGPMTLGTLSVSAYALLSIALFPRMPLWLAATTVWLLSAGLASVPAYLFIAWRRRRQARPAATA